MDANKILDTLAKPAGLMKKENYLEVPDANSLKNSYQKLTRHFFSKRNQFAEICIFPRAFKRQDEKFDEYVARLRKLAVHCNFGPALDIELCQQFATTTRIAAFENKSPVWKSCISAKPSISLAAMKGRKRTCLPCTNPKRPN